MRHGDNISISYDSEAHAIARWFVAWAGHSACGKSLGDALHELAGRIDAYPNIWERELSDGLRMEFRPYPVHRNGAKDWVIDRRGGGGHQTIIETMASADFFGIEWDDGRMTRWIAGFEEDHGDTIVLAADAISRKHRTPIPIIVWFRSKQNEHLG